MAHPVVWFEVNGKQKDTLFEFYAKLFDWKIDAENPARYGMVQTGGEEGIPGGIGAERGEAWPSVTFYVESPDLKASLSRAEELGGKTVIPPMQMKSRPELALFADPEGNLIGLVKS